MKRLLQLFSVIAFIVFLTSCEGKTGPMGPAGESGENYWYTDYIKVDAKDWNKNGEVGEPGADFFVVIDEEGIDEIAYEEGIVNVFIEIDEKVKIAMPHTVYHVENDGYTWSANYTYEYEIGKLIISVKYSDLDMNRKPESEYFYLVVTSPN